MRQKYLFKNRFIIVLLKIVDSILRAFPRKRKKIPDKISKVLIVKPDHLGDVLLMTSIIHLIRKRFPKSQIDIICSSSSRCIIEENPDITNIYNVDSFFLLRSKKSFRAFFRYVKQLYKVSKASRSEHYDVCLLLRAYGWNLITLGWWIRSRCLIGHPTAGFEKLLDVVVDWKEGVHEVEHYLEALQPLEIKASKISEMKSSLFPSKKDYAYINEVIKKHELKDFVIIHPGAGNREKMLEPFLWEKLIKAQTKQIVICGSQKDYSWFSALKISDVKMINLIGSLSVKQLYVLFRRANKIFALDSLSSHLSALSDTPSTIFFTKTDPKSWKPLGKNIEIVMDVDCYFGALERNSFSSNLPK